MPATPQKALSKLVKCDHLYVQHIKDLCRNDCLFRNCVWRFIQKWNVGDKKDKSPILNWILQTAKERISVQDLNFIPNTTYLDFNLTSNCLSSFYHTYRGNRNLRRNQVYAATNHQMVSKKQNKDNKILKISLRAGMKKTIPEVCYNYWKIVFNPKNKKTKLNVFIFQ